MRMPRLSPTQGPTTLIKDVLVGVGDVVKSHDLVLTVSVENLTSFDPGSSSMEIEIVEDGFRVEELLCSAGDRVAVDTPLAILIDESIPQCTTLDHNKIMSSYDSALVQAYVCKAVVGGCS